VESGPSKVIERAVGLLIPPASREEVLGDMRERCGSTREFLGEASHVVPFVIVSRVRRTSDPLLLLMEAVMAFTAFFTSAWGLERTLLYSEWGLVRLAIPVAGMLLALTIADAYSDPKKRWAMRPMVGPVLGIGLAFAANAAMGQWALPRLVMVWGVGIGMVMVSTMRMMFPPAGDQLQTARIPAFWSKLEAVPLKIVVRPLGYVLLIVVAIAYAVSRFWR
jgi:hypothetical protein